MYLAYCVAYRNRRMKALLWLTPLLLLLYGCPKRTDCPACAAGGPSTARQAVLEGEDEFSHTLVNALGSQKSPNILLLSGGGAHGAWGAGVLNGWTQKPRFDVVTGISTGSLISTFAFLGKQYDKELEDTYTGVSNSDIFRDRWWISLPFSSSVKTTGPLRELIAKHVTNAVIDEVAKESGKRLLLVGTVDFDKGTFVIWDLTRLAAASDMPDRYDRYRQILLAATAIPAIFPPVMIDGAMHVDGGIREQVFGSRFKAAVTRAYQATALRGGGLRDVGVGEPTVYIIINGQLAVRKECVDPYLLPMLQRTVNVVLGETMIGNLCKIQAGLGKIHLSRIPDDYPLNSASEEFNQEEMKNLFEAGKKWATASPISWESTVDAGESPLPCSDN